MQRSLLNIQVVCKVIIISIAFLFISFEILPSPIYSQDVGTPTDSPTNTETGTDWPTLTEPPAPTFTDTPLPTASPTYDEVPTITATLTEEATNDATETPSPIGSEVPIETTTEPFPTTETVTAVPTEPAMTLLINDNFDLGDLSNWILSEHWLLVPSDSGQALQINGSNDPATFAQTNLGDVAAQIRVIMNTGAAGISLRQSDAGAYTALLDMNGQVSFYRNEQLLGSALVSPITLGEWRTLRLSAIGDIVRVTIDGIEVITVQDISPLPLGNISFGGAGLSEGALRADDFALWVPLESEAKTSTATQTATATETTTSTLTASATLPADALSGDPSFSVLEVSALSALRPQFAQPLDIQPTPSSANLEFLAYRECGSYCSLPSLEYWQRDAIVESITGNGVRELFGPTARLSPGEPEYNGSLPLEVDLTVAMDGTYDLNGFSVTYPFYISPSNYAVQHQIQIVFKGADGNIISQSGVCQFTPGSSLGNLETVCPGFTSSLTYSQIHSVTFIYKTAQALGDLQGVTYNIGISSIQLRTTQVVYPPTPITPTATLTPSPTSTPDPCDYHPQNVAELIDAINNANNSGIFGASICLVPNETYSLEEGQLDGNGLPPITGTVRILGNNATIKRASDSLTPFRLFYVDTTGELSLNEVILGNGFADSGTIPDLGSRGGAIFNAGQLHVTDSVINDNTAADQGGAIYNEGNIDIHDSSINQNTATGYSGGAIANNAGSVTILGSTLANNFAGDGYNGWGGAIDTYNGGAVIISGSVIVGNTSGFAGGIDNYLGSLTIESSLLTGNMATAFEGSAITSNGETGIYQSCIQYNSGPGDIAIFNAGTELLQATFNWWGDASGPTHVTNPGGTGQAIGDNINYQFFLTQPNCDDGGLGGGSGNEQPPAPGGITSCSVQTASSGGDKRLHVDPSVTSAQVGLVSAGQNVFVVEQPTEVALHTWYLVNYGSSWGWIREDTLDATSLSSEAFTNCLGTLPSPLGAPTLTPTPTPIPPPTCIKYNQVDDVLTFDPYNDPNDPDDDAHNTKLYKNLISPCDTTDNPMVFDGLVITVDGVLNQQYQIMEEASSDVLEHVRDLHYGPTDQTPLITPRPTKPEPVRENFSNDQDYQAAHDAWFALWGDTANGAPTEETREAYERPRILNADFNSCGFFTLWYSMGALAILDRSQVRPYELMASAAEEHPGDKDNLGNSTGVDLTRNGFAWDDFLNEVGHNIAHGTNAEPVGDATVDEIAGLVRTSNTVVMVIVRIDKDSSSNSIVADGQIKIDDHLLSDDSSLISHWVIVTGVSADNLWFRILNPLNNQIEYYNRDEFSDSRDAGNGDIIIITG